MKVRVVVASVWGAMTARAWGELVLAVIAVVGLVVGCAQLFTGPVPQVVMAVALSVATLALTIGLVALLIVVARRDTALATARRWADALDNLTRAADELSAFATWLREAGHNRNPAGNDEVLERFVAHAKPACIELASAFKHVTGVEVRATLKQAWGVEDAPAHRRTRIRTLVSTSPRPTGTHDAADWAEDNTDFDLLLKGEAEVFFANDLFVELQKGYKNSHWTRAVLANVTRAEDLPYAATIVWPVRGQVDFNHGKPAWNTLGYLCVDARTTGIFDRKLDTAIGSLLADQFYSTWPVEA